MQVHLKGAKGEQGRKGAFMVRATEEKREGLGGDVVDVLLELFE